MPAILPGGRGIMAYKCFNLQFLSRSLPAFCLGKGMSDDRWEQAEG